MPTRSALVGRGTERQRLAAAAAGAQRGTGSLVLLAGEGGVGKSRLAEAAASDTDGLVLWGRASAGAAAPYGPVVAALRSYLRLRPAGLRDCGPLRSHLALILPELGEATSASDQATLSEAVLAAFACVAAAGESVAVVLDDLQWSDDATLELLPALAETLERLPVLAIACYRTDGLPRDHPLRRVRHELRRARRLDEIVLAPLDEYGTERLAAGILEAAPAPSLARALHERTDGVPYFVEELARALRVAGSLADGPQGLELVGEGRVPVPETVRDAVLLSVSELSAGARAAAEAAAVAGEDFELDLVAGVSSAAGVQELLERGLLGEVAPGRGAFRHSLAREALYADVPWLQRRTLHRQIAESLEAAGARAGEVATHWLGAREDARAREALLRAAAESRALHAHRDAARAGRQALELWREGEEPGRRIEALEAYADSAERSGELAEAARAWREVCTLRGDLGSDEEMGEARRRQAAVFDLQGDREAATEARRAAARAFERARRPARSATEHLALAAYARAGADYRAAIDLSRAAAEQARAAGRIDLQARALGLGGVAQAKRGDFASGLEEVRAGLRMALAHDLTGVAAELYQRLSLVLYDAADYPRARETLDTALELCDEETAEPETEVACVTCMVYVLRECGEWQRATAMGRQLMARGTAAWVAEGLVGAIHAYEGKFSSARRLLSASLAVSAQIGHFNMSVDSTTALAWVAAAEGADAEAAERCRSVLHRWEGSEDHHYALRGLRWGASYFARRDELGDAHRCVEALAAIASETGHPDALAALAHAIGEIALAEGDAATAAEQLARALELHRGLDVPLERTEIELRAGVALGAAGAREPALERLASAYRSARRLGARPLAAEAAEEVATLGDSVARRLGRRAAAQAEGAGLSRREVEVIRLVAAGRTNREVAEELVVSPRTVDMHVRNILRKLDCRSRTEAAHRAGELGILAG